MGFLDRLFNRPSPDKFASLLLQRLKQAVPDCDLVYNKEAFQLCPAGDNGMLINLANLYAEYRVALPAQRRELLDNCQKTFVSARKLQELSEEFDDVKARIMPTVRSRSYFDILRLSAEIELNCVPPKLPIFQPINDQLVCGFVYDSGPAMRFLHNEDVETWGTTMYELMELARMNFEQQTPIGISKIGTSFYSVLGDENYGATRLIQEELLARMEVEGDMVAVIPNRGTLMVTGTESVDGLKVMSDLLEKEVDHPRPISSVLFRRVGEEWEPWLPPSDHPTYAAFKLAATRSIGGEYHEQKEVLEKLYATRGEDVFVASFSGTEHKATGVVALYCVWPQGTLTMLPKTDLIGLIDRQEEVIGMVPWDEVERLAGNLLQPQGMYPERYRVELFLSQEQLAALKTKAT